MSINGEETSSGGKKPLVERKVETNRQVNDIIQRLAKAAGILRQHGSLFNQQHQPDGTDVWSLPLSVTESLSPDQRIFYTCKFTACPGSNGKTSYALSAITQTGGPVRPVTDIVTFPFSIPQIIRGGVFFGDELFIRQGLVDNNESVTPINMSAKDMDAKERALNLAQKTVNVFIRCLNIKIKANPSK